MRGTVVTAQNFVSLTKKKNFHTHKVKKAIKTENNNGQQSSSTLENR